MGALETALCAAGSRNLPEGQIVTKAGLAWVFEKAIIYGDVYDFLTMLNRPTAQRRFGEYLGVIIEEVPDERQRILIEYTYMDPRIEARKRHKANLRRHGIAVWRFKKFMKRNTLDRWTKATRKANTF